MMQLWLGTKADWSETHFWKYLHGPQFNVELRVFDIITHKTSVLKIIREAGSARQALDIPFEAKILLCTIMLDNNLDCLHEDDYIRLIEDVKPDLATSIEIFLYDDDTGEVLQQRKEKFFNHLIALRKRFSCDKIVVLIPGRTPDETKWFAERAYHLGFRKMGIPCADSMQRNRRYCKGQIHSDLKILKQYATEIFLFGLSSLSNIEEFSYADHLVTRGWYNLTMKFKQELSQNGSRKATIPPKIMPKQQIFCQDGSLIQGNCRALNLQRQLILRTNATKAIEILLKKLYFIEQQQSLEEYVQWQAKVEAIQDQVTAPQPIKAQEDLEGIRV